MAASLYLERKFGKRGGRGLDVPAPQEAFAVDPQFQGPDEADLVRDAHEGAAGQLVEMLTRRGVTSEEMAEARAYLEEHPHLSTEYRAEFMASLDRVKDMKPEQVREILEKELKIINDPNTSPAELDKYKKDGILAPLILPLQMLQPAVGGERAGEELGKVAEKKMGKIKRHRTGERMRNSIKVGTITGVATGLDYTFGKAGIEKISDVIIEYFGLEKALQMLGGGLYGIYDKIVSFAIQNGAPMSAIEQLALGKGLVSTGLTAGFLYYLFERKRKVEKPTDLVNIKKHPIHAGFTSVVAGVFLLSGAAMVDKRITEAGHASQLGKKTKANWSDKSPAIAKAGKTVGELPKKMQEPIDAAVKKAFETGVTKVGPLTAGSWLALEGDVPDAKGRMIADRYLREMGTGDAAFQALQKAVFDARTALDKARKSNNADTTKVAEAVLDEAEKKLFAYTGEIKLSDSDKRRFDGIVAAVKKVNEKKAYVDLGAQQGFGAKKFIETLTKDLPREGQEMESNLTSMLAVMDKKEKITLDTAVLGNWKFWYVREFINDLVKHQPSFEQLYKMQKDYPSQPTALLNKVTNLAIGDTYITDMERELNAAGVPIKLRDQINLSKSIPKFDFTADQLKTLFVPEKGADFNFEKVLHPSAGTDVYNMIWGTDEAWAQRDALVARDAVNLNLKENVYTQTLYKGTIASIFVFLLVGSVWWTGVYRGRINRIDEENLDKDTEDLHAKEGELVEGMAHYLEAQNVDVVGQLNKEGAGVSSTTLINDVFKKHLAFVLRREVLKATPDPREWSKMMSESPDGIAFMNQTSKRFDPDGEYSKQIRDAYVKKLNEWMDQLKANPLDTVADLLAQVDPQFKTTAEALVKLNAANPGTKERDQAFEGLKIVFEKRKTEQLSAQASRLAFDVARLEARATAIRKMVGDQDEVDIMLNGGDPGLTRENIVASYILSDIDAEAFALRATIEALQARGAVVTPPDPKQTELTEAEWQKENKAFLDREIANLSQGSTIQGNEADIVRQMNSFVGSISDGILPIQADLENHLKTINPNASIAFKYGYSGVRRGPTITAILSDSRSNESIAIPFTYKIPSQEGSSSNKVLDHVKEWAKPDGVLSQRLRVNALFDNNRTEFQDALQKLQSVSPSLQFDQATAIQNADIINTLMRTGDIWNAQKPLMKDLSDDKPLTPEQIRYFTDPMQSGIRVWKGSFTNALDRAVRARFSNLVDKKLIVAFDQNYDGFIAAVPNSATIPVDIAAVPDYDKMSILRASRS